MRKLSIKGSDSYPIAIDFSEASARSPLIVFIHGFKGFKDWGTHELVAKYFNQQGFSFLKFNFSHNGISPNEKFNFDDLEGFGKNTFSRELSDLDEVLTFALSGEAFPPPEELYLIGHSRGGGIGIIQTAEDPRIKKLVTWASVSRFNNLWSPGQEQEWRQNGVIYTLNGRTKQEMPLYLSLLEDLEHHSERLDITNAAKALHQPWLIIHGDKDPAVPVEQAFELQRQNPRSEIYIVPEGDHVFGGKHPWLETLLPIQLNQVCRQTSEFLLKP